MGMSQFENTKHFCVLPWIHQMVGPDGRMRVCCTQTRKMDNVSDVGPDQQWNSGAMRGVRRRMLNDEYIEGCERCYKLEEFGKSSGRIYANTQWLQKDGIIDIIERSKDNDFAVDESPKYLDLRFGNLCNLVCKMCHGASSSQIAKDNDKLRKLDPAKYKELIDEDTEFNFDWYTKPEVWEIFQKYVPNIESIYLTGGEPTLIEQNQEFLELCIKMGYADKIDLRFNTNLTNINQKFIDTIKQFRHVHFACSIDGSGLIQEYIRYPSKWDIIVRNFHTLWNTLERKKARFSVNMVGQLLNVMNMDSCLDDIIAMRMSVDDLQKFDFWINIESLTYPEYYAIQNAPKIVKDVARDRMTAWLDKTMNSPEGHWHFKNDYADAKAIITQIQKSSNMESHKQTLLRLNFIDSNKPISLETHIPELHTALGVSVAEEAANRK